MKGESAMSETSTNSDFVQYDQSAKERLYAEEYQDLELQGQSVLSQATPHGKAHGSVAFLPLWLRQRWRQLGWILSGILALCLLLRFGHGSQVALASSPTLISVKEQNWQSINTIFFFGDSYTSTVMADLEKSPPRLLKKLEINETGVYRRKPNWVTFWTEVYSQSALTGYNFAMGGSTVDSNVVKPYLAGSSFRDQSRDWTQWYGQHEKAAVWDPQTTLFVAWFGVNDVALTHGRSKEALNLHQRPPLPEVFEAYASSVKQLYDSGARNFLFLTCPPLDLSHKLHPPTEFLIQEKFDETTDVHRFNARLYEMQDALRTNYSAMTTAVFDAHRFWSRVIETPQEFPQTKDVVEARVICQESLPGDMPVNGNYANNTCRDGLLIRQHMWTDMHATYPIHNATAWRIVEDCMGPSGPKQYCL